MLTGAVRLQVRPPGDGVEVRTDSGMVVETGPDGSFAMLGVPAGPVIVTARRAGYLDSETAVEVGMHEHKRLGETLLLAGDVWADGTIDVLDVMSASAALGRCAGGPNFQEWFDLDGSGCVDATDLQIVASNFGHRGPTQWQPVPGFP